ncbi:CRTAC1 family protein, partial [bacterium]|nr:CRTAC1 family protein [bacterium]
VSAGVDGNSPRGKALPAWSTGAAWVDIDLDGWLDLFVCNYVKWTPETDLFTTLDGKTKSYATPEQYQGETCRLYRNLGGKRFEDITEKAGVHNPHGKSLGIAVSDFDADGWPDLFVANDTQPNFLYINNRNGTFTDIALRAGVAYDEFGRARAGMGVDVADIKNQGSLSIAIGNFAREPLSLYTQINPELFQDLAGGARLTKSSILQLTFGLQFIDLDLDGFLDLVVGNGHIEPEINKVQQEITFAQTPQVFLNDSQGRFKDVSANVGESFQRPIVARGIASADIDDDGDLDLLITVNGGSPLLLQNEIPHESRQWLKLKLVGTPPNRKALGARVTLWAGHLKQVRMVRTGSSYLSQSYTDELVFGLADQAVVDSIAVAWPSSGKVTKVRGLDTKKTHVIQENASDTHSEKTNGR